jgi:hypothetical protein
MKKKMASMKQSVWVPENLFVEGVILVGVVQLLPHDPFRSFS